MRRQVEEGRAAWCLHPASSPPRLLPPSATHAPQPQLLPPVLRIHLSVPLPNPLLSSFTDRQLQVRHSSQSSPSVLPTALPQSGRLIFLHFTDEETETPVVPISLPAPSPQSNFLHPLVPQTRSRVFSQNSSSASWGLGPGAHRGPGRQLLLQEFLEPRLAERVSREL